MTNAFVNVFSLLRLICYNQNIDTVLATMLKKLKCPI